MDNNRFLHCEYLYTDTIHNMNDVQRLSDGRLFTVGMIGKASQGGKYCCASSDQFLFGRISEDEGKSWQVSFLKQLPESTALTLVGDFLIDRDGRIHIFFVHIYSMDPHFCSAGAYNGDITYARLDDAYGNGMIYKKIDALDRYTGSMNCVLQLESGRIIAPFSTIAKVAGSAFVSSVVYSDDGGDTWFASNDVSVVSNESSIESGAVEPIVVKAADGVLVMLIRTVLNRLYYAVSYDEGETWTQAEKTNIPSSNAPGGVVRLANGRIVLAWNNALGYPMTGTRYSTARQCLHAAVSEDGLKTLRGVRMIMRKRNNDPDNVFNCYPFCTPASDTEAFVRPFSVQDREGAMWVQAQAHLLRLNPDDLLEDEMHDRFDEWITDCEADENGIRMTSDGKEIAYACVNFPYAQQGSIIMQVNGQLPAEAKILLSDCYIDRATFRQKDNSAYDEYVQDLYEEVVPTAGGRWEIRWDECSVTLLIDDQVCAETQKMRSGFNHLAVLLKGADGKLDITHFEMQRMGGDLETGIEY